MAHGEGRWRAGRRRMALRLCALRLLNRTGLRAHSLDHQGLTDFAMRSKAARASRLSGGKSSVSVFHSTALCLKGTAPVPLNRGLQTLPLHWLQQQQA